MPKLFLVVGNDYRSLIIDKLPHDIIVFDIDSINQYKGVIPESSKICVTHEEALEAIRHKMPDSSNSKAMELFRDKSALRLMLKPYYPDFFFKKIKIHELSSLELSFGGHGSKYVIKPVKGFFGIGVRIIDQDTNLINLEIEISNEVSGQIQHHPDYLKDGSLSVEDFLIEEYIGSSDESDLYSLEHAEIAVDGYYDKTGKFVLLNVYHHPYHKNRKYFHLLYYTSKDLFERFFLEASEFFNDLRVRSNLDIKSFPVHAEFKVYNGKLFLLEVNPGRFGGLGLSDLIYYAFGINAYEFFYFDKTFSWQSVWKDTDAYYAWVLAYKGNDFMRSGVAFNHQDFQKFLGTGLLSYDLIDYDDSVSAIAFVKKDSRAELEKILNVEFNDFHHVD